MNFLSYTVCTQEKRFSQQTLPDVNLCLYVIVEPMQLDNGVDEPSSGSNQVCNISLIRRVLPPMA